jgi:hypothetical protein
MLGFLKPLIGPIIDKALDLIPNSNDRARAKEDLERKLISAVVTANKAQTKINEIEAGHVSMFVAGWRPFIGWVCGFGVAWVFVVQPTLIWLMASFDIGITNIPEIDTDGLFQLVIGMLGMSGLRTYEKLKGVSRSTKI